MKLTTRQDIEAPLDFVYAQLTDFEQFERMVMRRGAEVERIDRLARPGPGMGWRLRFAYKGKPRKVVVRLLDLAQDALLDYAFDSPSVEGGGRLELIALAPRRTRMTLAVEIRPKTLAARLFLQSLRLAKGRVQRRFDKAGGKLAGLIEDRSRTVG
ncbi:SRPBCC family protein [Pseudogemmobacter sonorensis]|uniref:SRPBCC family protein n=1 Tax=Pseudogemmobacter sonorensis TaxID=2989681 RepID=UPI0036C7E1E9